MLCNADPKVALDLLEEAAVPAGFEDRLREWKVRSPVMKLNAAVTELPRWSAAGGETWPALGTMSVTGGLDTCQESFEACERGEVAIGFGEIYSQTASDPSVAPEGKHVISVFAQYAPAEADGEWDVDARRRRARADRPDRAPRAGFRAVDRGVRAARPARHRGPDRPQRRQHLPGRVLSRPDVGPPIRRPHPGGRASTSAAPRPTPAAASSGSTAATRRWRS